MVSPDPEKTNRVENFPVPKGVTSLCQFVGLGAITQGRSDKIPLISGSIKQSQTSPAVPARR